MSNRNLKIAKERKYDEFYTRYEDIEKKVNEFKDKFKNKIVYCNCDSKDSNFTKYFLDNFYELELKKLICTAFEKDGNGAMITTTNPKKNIAIKKLNGDGDFRSNECVQRLKECDIVVSNPPFSLLRDYVNLIFEYSKDFLIIGNHNTICTKSLFNFFKEGKINACGRINHFTNHEKSKVNVGAAYWFTSFDVYREPLKLICKYNKDKYPTYSNYKEAINVDKTDEIPCDYYGIIGVPLSFMHKYNKEQFEIVGLSSNIKIVDVGIYKRIFIKKRQ